MFCAWDGHGPAEHLRAWLDRGVDGLRRRGTLLWERPLFSPALAVLAAVLLARQRLVPTEIVLVVALAFFLIGLLVCVSSFRRQFPWRGLVIIPLVLSLSLFRTANDGELSLNSGDELFCGGRVDDCRERKSGWRSIIRADWVRARGERQNVRELRLCISGPRLEPGDKVCLLGHLRPSGGFFNRLPSAGSSENESADLLFLERVQVLSRQPAPPSERLRRGMIRRIGELLDRGIRPEERGLLLALLLGDDEGLDDELRRQFREAGLLHLLVVSGFHLTLISLVLLRCFPCRNPVPVLGLIWSYAWLCGGGVSLFRAAVAASGPLLAGLVGRRGDALNGLCGAFIVQLLLDPASLSSPGLLFSYSITLALLLSLPPSGAGAFRRLLFSSLAVSAALLPISALLDGYCNLTTLLATPPAGALVELILVSALVVLPLIVVFPFMAGLLLYLPGLALRLLRGLASVFAADPWILAGPELRLLLIALLPLPLLALLPRRRGLTLSVILLPFFFFPACASRAPLSSIDFPDVGQGLCMMLVQNRQALIIDTGDAANLSADRVLLPLLRREGISPRAIVVTHLDRDHAGNAGRLWRAWPRCPVYLPGSLAGDRRLDSWLSGQGIPRERVIFRRRGDEIRAAGFCLSVLWPPENVPESLTGDDNAMGLVLHAALPGGSLLVSGDATRSVEARIARDLGGPLRLLQVSHHGSRTGSGEELLRRLQPEHAVISCGRANRHGHPHRETLYNLCRSDSCIWRSDLHGRIRFRIRPSGDWVGESARRDPRGGRQKKD